MESKPSFPTHEVPASKALYERAVKLMPAGVNSPVRAFRAVGGTPVYIARGKGAHIWDADGNRYVDFCGSWGPLILGHAHPRVLAAVHAAAERGLTYGAPHEGEVALAEKVISLHPHLERMRFVSSGTEAVMSAVRVARGATGRPLVVKFDGCYHGHVDHLLVNAGSGLATFGTPSSAGVPEDFAKNTVVVDLDDRAGFDALVEKRGREIAAVLIEPIPANNGLLLQRQEFLEHLRKRTTEIGACLIFDEVISGFRVAMGGAAQRLRIRPDLATYGKIIGGGLPVGAYGGRKDLMDHVAPLGRVYQAGTLSGNPLGMAAGLETIRVLEEENVHQKLESLGAQLEERLCDIFRRRSANASVVRMGSIFWMSLQAGEAPRTAGCIESAAAARFAPLYHFLLRRGIYFGPSAFEVAFLSSAHGEPEIEALATALNDALGAGIGR
ncbi:MAG: glutamate-1-semialdehyde 2,1-aminomutase [Planctomycetes bacterium]|nr:glutamate-1-semialdehyde 2,1-aminomutase [Planctomycetota bacterium]